LSAFVILGVDPKFSMAAMGNLFKKIDISSTSESFKWEICINILGQSFTKSIHLMYGKEIQDGYIWPDCSFKDPVQS
jgi:hypothetical protein